MRLIFRRRGRVFCPVGPARDWPVASRGVEALRAALPAAVRPDVRHGLDWMDVPLDRALRGVLREAAQLVVSRVEDSLEGQARGEWLALFPVVD